MTTNDSQSSQNSAPLRRVRKAVLPAAGLGTRFLPATKAQPKEMLAVVDKPQIQYVAEECVASGIEHIIIVTGRGKSSIEDHFDASPFLEAFLEKHGKKQQARMVRNIADMVQVSYTRQKEPLGLGHAVLVARDLVGDEPFAVLLGDVLIPGENPATKQLIDVYSATGVGAIAVEEVPKDRTHLYGIVAGEPAPQPPLGRVCCAFVTWWRSRSQRMLRRTWRSPVVTSCHPLSSIASSKPSPAPATRFSLPTVCACWPRSKACGPTSTKGSPTTPETSLAS